MELAYVSAAEIRSSEAVQRGAWQLLSSSVAPEQALMLGISILERKGALFHAATQIPLPQFNKVFSLGVDGDLTDDDIDSAKRWIAERCSEPSFIMVPPVVPREDLDERMARHGLSRYHHDYAVCHLSGEVGDVAPRDNLEVRAVSTSEAAIFDDVLREGLGMDDTAMAFSSIIGQPDLTGYIAWQGEVAMGAGTLFAADGWASLWLTATRPAYRRRGVQAALLNRRIADGRAAGVHTFNVAVLNAAKPHGSELTSYRNAMRAGFKLAYIRPIYVLAR